MVLISTDHDLLYIASVVQLIAILSIVEDRFKENISLDVIAIRIYHERPVTRKEGGFFFIIFMQLYFFLGQGHL